jgi:peroxygenase
MLMLSQWFAAFFEWGTTWLLIQKNNKVYREDLRGIYDVWLPSVNY